MIETSFLTKYYASTRQSAKDDGRSLEESSKKFFKFAYFKNCNSCKNTNYTSIHENRLGEALVALVSFNGSAPISPGAWATHSSTNRFEAEKYWIL